LPVLLACPVAPRILRRARCTVAAYVAGCVIALVLWSFTRYVPDKPVALLLLGLTPFATRLAPAGLRPNADSAAQGTLYGVICMSLMLLTGVTGPLIDTFFLGGKLDRKGIVARKAACRVFSHAMKLVYFGGVDAHRRPAGRPSDRRYAGLPGQADGAR
jgi:uncharacterized protein